MMYLMYNILYKQNCKINYFYNSFIMPSLNNSNLVFVYVIFLLFMYIFKFYKIIRVYYSYNDFNIFNSIPQNKVLKNAKITTQLNFNYID